MRLKFGSSKEEQADAGEIFNAVRDGYLAREAGEPITHDADGTPVYRVLLGGMFGPPEEHLQATPNGLLCSVCYRPQYICPSGTICENNHGGCEGIPVPVRPPPAPATQSAMQDLLTCVEVRWPEESPLVRKAMAADMHWVAQQISDDPPTAKQYLGHEVWNVVFLDLCSIAETHWHVSGPLMKGMAVAMLQAALQKGQMP
jgi:hypothetical protein